MWKLAEQVDKSLSIPALIAVEFAEFNDLQRHYAPNLQYPSDGLFIEGVPDHQGEEALRKILEMPILNGLVFAEEADVKPDETNPLTHRMTYRPHPQYPDGRFASPVVVARAEGDGESGVHETGIGWQLRRSGFHPAGQEVGRLMMFPNHSSLLLGTAALTLRCEWDSDGGDFGVVARQYFNGPNAELSEPKREIPVTRIPEETVKDFMQVFKNAAWESVSEPA